MDLSVTLSKTPAVGLRQQIRQRTGFEKEEKILEMVHQSISKIRLERIKKKKTIFTFKKLILARIKTMNPTICTSNQMMITMITIGGIKAPPTELS
jgi:hypothetical protein